MGKLTGVSVVAYCSRQLDADTAKSFLLSHLTLLVFLRSTGIGMGDHEALDTAPPGFSEPDTSMLQLFARPAIYSFGSWNEQPVIDPESTNAYIRFARYGITCR